jgi:DNA-binding transcriptional regulator YiaG
MSRQRDESRITEAVRLYHEERLTRDEVARRLGVRGRTVSYWLDGEARSRGRRKREDVSDDEILALRDQDHLSFREIALTTGLSKTGVRMRYYSLTGRQRPDRPGAVVGR